MAPPMSNNDSNGGDNTTSTPNNSSSTTTASFSKGRTSVTPTRPSNNYASTNTPIASAKRPTKKRTPVPSSSAKKSSSSSANGRAAGGSNNNNSSSTPQTPIHTPAKTTSSLSSKKDHAGGAGSNNSNNKEATTPARYVNLSPMHNVKPVPRDSHHTTGKTTTNNDNEEEGDIVTAESTLSVVTEGPTATTAAAATNGGGATSTTTEMSTESPSNNSASAWVGRKVDAIFSPVLSFLNGAGASSSSSSCGGGEEKDGDGEKKADNDGSDRSEKENKLEKKMSGAVGGDDVEDEVENMVKSNLQKDVEYTRSRTDSSFDDIPGMTNTDSSGSNVIDADGDVTMADCYMNQRDKEDGTDDNEQYLKVTLNNTEEEEEVEEEYYDEDEDDEEEFNPYLFIKSLPPYEYALPPGWKNRPKALPPADHDSHPICLVLDLDETLVHCTVEPVANADMIFPVEFNGMNYQVHVRCRPFLTEFLEAVSKKFEVVIFTASQQVYADKLLDKIDPEGKYIRYRMFRDSCLPVEGNYLKDLTVLGRDLSKAVLVDNSPHAFGYQVDNGIPIESWFDDPKDKELLKLEKFLRTLHGAEDVREVVRNTFQSHLLVKNA